MHGKNANDSAPKIRLVNCPSAKVFNFYQKISRAAAVFNEIFSLSCKGLALKFA